MLDPIYDRQPLRTVGELRQFIANLPDEMLLTSHAEYESNPIFPIMVRITPDNPFENDPQAHWFDFARLHIGGYVRYRHDPNLENSWQEVEAAVNA